MSHYSVAVIHKENQDIDEKNYPSYLDYVVSQNNYKTSSRFEKDSDFWNYGIVIKMK